MDDKEKYRQALERAKLAIKECGDNKGRISMIESIFPELSESEDERVRKDIMVLVKDWWDRVNKDNISTKEEMIAWLEKQGELTQSTTKTSEQEEGIIEIPFGAKDRELQEAIYNIPKGFHAEIKGDSVLIKKGKQKPEIEEINGEDYGIDGLWHAQRILEKTLGKVDGYRSDDGILDHKAAITAVKKLCEQKPAWSDEDEENLQHCCGAIAAADYYTVEDKQDMEAWLKSLKERLSKR